MKKNRLFLMLTMLVAAIVLSSCSKSVPDYAKLIPDDADMVARIDVRQLAAKSGFGKGDGVNSKIKQALKEKVSEKTQKKILEIMDSPAQAGLDLRDPVMIYVCSSKQEVGLVGTMWKKDRFTDLLNVLADEVDAGKVQSDGDLSYIKLNDVLVTFNDDWFHIGVCQDGNIKTLAKEIAKRGESDKGSITGNAAFQRMCKKTGVAQLLVRGQWLNDNGPELFGSRYYDDYYFDEENFELMPEESAWTAENPFDEFKKVTDVDISATDILFDLEINRAEAKGSVELFAAGKDGAKQIATFDKIMGGKKDGLFVRLGFGLLNTLAKQNPDYNEYTASLMGRLIKFVELKYEGDARLTLRLVTRDITKTPIESAVSILHEEFGL